MTATNLQEIGASEYAAWFRANTVHLLHRSPFHDPAWLRASAAGTGFDLGFIGLFEGGDLVAAVPGFLTRRGPFRLFGSPLRGTMTSYLGPVSLDARFVADGQRDLALALTDFVRRNWRASYARFTTRDAPPEGRSPPDPNWHEQRPKSYRLDLSPGEAALFAGLKSHCRRNVRKAAREGVAIVPLQDARLFYRILQNTFRRHGSSSWHSGRFFELLMSELPQHNLLWAWGARYDGQVIAAGLFLHDDREMHFISGASLPGYGSLPTSYLLHWHAIARAAREGLGVFNSDASRIPSIDQFKETFNPVLEKRSTLMWAPSFVWESQRAFRAWNKKMRHLRSLLPVALMGR